MGNRGGGGENRRKKRTSSRGERDVDVEIKVVVKVFRPQKNILEYMSW